MSINRAAWVFLWSFLFVATAVPTIARLDLASARDIFISSAIAGLFGFFACWKYARP